MTGKSEDFTVRVFADFSAASAEMERFAAKHKAVVSTISKPGILPSQAQTVAAPHFQSAGAISQVLGASAREGTITSDQLKSLRKILNEANKEARTALQEAGVFSRRTGSRDDALIFQKEQKRIGERYAKAGKLPQTLYQRDARTTALRPDASYGVFQRQELAAAREAVVARRAYAAELDRKASFEVFARTMMDREWKEEYDNAKRAAKSRRRRTEDLVRPGQTPEQLALRARVLGNIDASALVRESLLGTTSPVPGRDTTFRFHEGRSQAPPDMWSEEWRFFDQQTRRARISPSDIGPDQAMEEAWDPGRYGDAETHAAFRQSYETWTQQNNLQAGLERVTGREYLAAMARRIDAIIGSTGAITEEQLRALSDTRGPRTPTPRDKERILEMLSGGGPSNMDEVADYWREGSPYGAFGQRQSDIDYADRFFQPEVTQSMIDRNFGWEQARIAADEQKRATFKPQSFGDRSPDEQMPWEPFPGQNIDWNALTQEQADFLHQETRKRLKKEHAEFLSATKPLRVELPPMEFSEQEILRRRDLLQELADSNLDVKSAVSEPKPHYNPFIAPEGATQLNQPGVSAEEWRASQDEQARAASDQATSTRQNTADEDASSEKLQESREDVAKQLQRTLAKARDQIALAQDPDYLAARAKMAQASAQVGTHVDSDPDVQEARAARRVAVHEAAAQLAQNEDVRAAADERLKQEKLSLLAGRARVASDSQVTQATEETIKAQRLQTLIARTRAKSGEEVIVAEADLKAAEILLAREARRRAANDPRILAFDAEQERRKRGDSTFFQRGFSRFTGTPIDNAPTGPAFFGRKAATTAGFALSSVALFSIASGIGTAFKEAEELDRVMNDIGFQLDSLRERGDIPFEIPQVDEVREQILGIARTTGLAADEVGRVAFQLQGAFGGDNVRAMRETAAAAEFVRITGLGLEETVDSFTALTQSFEGGELSAREFGDTAFGLQERFGVLAKEILVFASDLAPVAAATGFTVQELEALGAAAQKFSGRSGSSLAEAFGRIIPQVRENATEFIGLFSSTAGLRDQVGDLTQAFGAGDIQKVFEILIGSYKEMSKQQRSYVVDLLGGRREAASLIGVLENGDEILKEWNGTFNDSGKQAERFATFQETVTQSIAKFTETMKQLGIQILESGVKDFFQWFLESGTSIIGLFSDLGGALSALNFNFPFVENFKGVPAQLLAMLGTIKLIKAALSSRAVTKMFAGSGIANLATPGAMQQAAGFAVDNFFMQRRAARASSPIDNVPLRPEGQGAIPLGPIGSTGLEMGLAGNMREGFKKSFAKNRGTWIGLGVFLGAQIIEGVASGIISKQQEHGADAFSSVREQIDAGEEISSYDRQRLEQAAAQQTNIGITAQRNISKVPIVGEAIAGLSGIVTAMFSNAETINAEMTEARLILNAESSQAVTEATDALRNAGLTDTGQVRIYGQRPGVSTIDNPNPAPVEEVIPQSDIDAILAKVQADEELSDQEQMIYEAWEARINWLKEHGNKRTKDVLNGTAEEQLFETASKDLEAITAQYEAGLASRGEYIAALRMAAVGAEGLINSGGGSAEELADAAAKLQKYEAEISAGIIGSIETLNKFRSYEEGEEDPARTAQQFLTAIQSGSLTPQDMETAVFGYLEAQRAILQLRIDAADTVEEANRIAREGIANSPEIRVQAIAIQLGEDNGFATFSSNLVDATGGVLAGVASVGELTENISAIVAFTGASLEDSALLFLDQQIANLEMMLTTSSSMAGLEEGARLLAQLKEFRRRIRQGGGSLNETTVDDPTRTRAEQQEAADEAENRASELADARFTLLESMTENSVELAHIAVARARDDLARAKGPAEIKQAQAALNDANNGLRDAIYDVYDSQFDLLESATEDPVKLARLALARAQADLARARATGDAASINRALAAVNTTRRGVRDALQEVMNAQTNLLIAIADAAGDSVKSAQLAHQQALRDLRRIQEQGGGQAALRNARARVVSTQAGVRDALLARRQDHYQFLYDMGRITTGQLVAYLQSLLAIPGITRDQVEDIQLQIRNLRQELGQDFQFNLPTELALPTFYEVRRADQSGGRNFTDQRQVTVNVNVSSNVDLAALESVLAASVGTNVNGTIPRRY